MDVPAKKQQISLTKDGISTICGRFEAARKAGHSPDIAAYLTEVSESEHAALLRRLLKLEWAHPNGNVSLEEYLSRFPQHQELIRSLFEEVYGANQTKSYGAATIDFAARERIVHSLPSVPGYEILNELGHGGMGIVYQARQLKPKRLVALKVMKPELAADPTARKRFVREAQAMAAMQHDHVVTIYHVGEEGGTPFLAMELLRGETLHQRLTRDKRLPVSEVVRIGREIAQGLSAAHQAGLVHRDIKPGNLWLEEVDDRSCVKILDFGLARVLMRGTQLSEQGVVMGTPQFMSPEQARGAEVDARSDLFSLGAVLFRIATGEVPFRGNSLPALQKALEQEEPPPPRDLNPELPKDLADLILTLLRKKPDQRPQTAQEVASKLSELGQTSAPAPRPSPSKSKKMYIALAGAGLAVIFCLIASIAAIVLLAFWIGPFRPAVEPDKIDVAQAKPKPEPVKVDLPALMINVAAGSSQESRHRVEAGAVEGRIEIDYDMYAVPDRMTIYYDGKMIHDTGPVSGKGKVNVNFGPGTSTFVQIVMNEGAGQGKAGTTWTLNGQVIPRGFPKDGAVGPGDKGPGKDLKATPEVQAVSITGAPGLRFTMNFNGATTAPIVFPPNAASAQAALNALSTVGGAGGGVTVSNYTAVPGRVTFDVTFTGSLAGRTLPLMVVTTIGAGGDATVSRKSGR